MARRTLIALILFAAQSCGGNGGGGKPDSAVAPGDAWVELGTGTTAFEELPDESELVLVAGPQGGHHFIAHARMYGLAPGDPMMPGTVQNPTTRFTVWSESGDQLDIEPPPYKLGYEPVGDDVFALASGHIIQVREEEVPAMVGTRVRLAVELTDANGARVTDERWVTAVEDTGGDPQADAGPPPAWVELGTGIDEWEPIAPEADLVLYAGPQGGHHFLMRARLMGLNPGDADVPGSGPSTVLAVWSEGGAQLNVVTAALQFRYVDVGGGVYEIAGAPHVLTMKESEYPAVVGDRVRVTLEVTDDDGLQATDERWVRVVEP